MTAEERRAERYDPRDGAVNHWHEYGLCDRAPEHCRSCGRVLIEHIEPGAFRDSKTGLPTYARYHSCPTWVVGWRTSRWARWWACPGMGHDSHDADNPLRARGYR